MCLQAEARRARVGPREQPAHETVKPQGTQRNLKEVSVATASLGWLRVQLHLLSSRRHSL